MHPDDGILYDDILYDVYVIVVEAKSPPPVNAVDVHDVGFDLTYARAAELAEDLYFEGRNFS